VIPVVEAFVAGGVVTGVLAEKIKFSKEVRE